MAQDYLAHESARGSASDWGQAHQELTGAVCRHALARVNVPVAVTLGHGFNITVSVYRATPVIMTEVR